MLKKILNILLIVSILLCFDTRSSFVFAEDDDDGTEEKTTYQKCVEDKDRAACSALVANQQSNLKDIEKQIAAAESDREAARALANEYAMKAESMQAEINNLARQIAELEDRIVELEISIAENEKKVNELNER
ncbi:MAG: hypothetical protein IKX97_01970, partial [Erysipelotrichaceae bacterium]|nr:hypothetical protein [Erysipelotrichaceae bacterium]